MPSPADGVTVHSDAGLADALSASERRPVIVRGGDLHATLGSPVPGPSVMRVPIDVMHVRADDRTSLAVAHVVARRPGRLGWWRGPVAAVMNVDHLGSWDVAPRAHPNDGLLDVLEVAASMSRRQRWQAWRRLRTGTHVPHPAISVRRTPKVAIQFDRPVDLRVDGRRCGTVTSLDVTVEPDAASIHV